MKAAAGSSRFAEQQRPILWLALALADAEHRAGHALAARAVLETALDLLGDAGHRHLVMCRMVKHAVRDGDLRSADAWLAECDPASEVLELDSAYRHAEAQIHTAKQDSQAVLSVLGAERDDIPTAPAFELAFVRLRIHAHESLGHLDVAYRQLKQALEKDPGSALVPGLVERGLAPQSVARTRRDEIDGLVERRDRLPLGFAAFIVALRAVPIVAFGLLIAVTIPRCVFDADPFLGLHGNILCPSVCQGCHGPFRIYTTWHHDGGEHSTNGPQYFCRTASNRVGSMPDAEFESHLKELEKYELDWAPAAATYLTLLALLVPFAVVAAFRRHKASIEERTALQAELDHLSAVARLEVPPPSPFSRGPPAARTLTALAVSVIAPLLVIAIELASHG
jgi:hypothetical protein